MLLGRPAQQPGQRSSLRTHVGNLYQNASGCGRNAWGGSGRAGSCTHRAPALLPQQLPPPHLPAQPPAGRAAHSGAARQPGCQLPPPAPPGAPPSPLADPAARGGRCRGRAAPLAGWHTPRAAACDRRDPRHGLPRVASACAQGQVDQGSAALQKQHTSRTVGGGAPAAAGPAVSAPPPPAAARPGSRRAAAGAAAHLQRPVGSAGSWLQCAAARGRLGAGRLGGTRPSALQRRRRRHRCRRLHQRTP